MRSDAGIDAARPVEGRARYAGSAEEILQAAIDLTPLVAQRAEETEQLRRLPDATIRDFHETGLFRMFQPASVGGMELPPRRFFDVCSQLARGCASSAWVLGNLAAHHQLMAHWPERAQDEVWGVDPDHLIGSSYVFSAGKARHCAGGFRLKGRWPFSSGIHHCQWLVVGATLEDDGEAGMAGEQIYYLLPSSDYHVLDTWKVVGLSGTGSCDLTVSDIYVPAHRAVSYLDVFHGRSPGLALHPGALFRFPTTHSAGGFVLVSVLHGAAKGALDDFIRATSGRVNRSTGELVAESAHIQLKVALAAQQLDLVEMTVLDGLKTAMQAIESGKGIVDETHIRLRRDAASCASLCVSAMNAIFAASGGGGLYTNNPVQRAWRDVNAGAAHFGLQWDVSGSIYGRLLLGLPSGMPGLKK